MGKHQVIEDFDIAKKSDILLFLKLILVAASVVALGLYVGDLLFGKNSLEVLLNLQDKREMLSSRIKKYKRENAVLQKEYFELLQLEPESDWKEK